MTNELEVKRLNNQLILTVIKVGMMHGSQVGDNFIDFVTNKIDQASNPYQVIDEIIKQVNK